MIVRFSRSPGVAAAFGPREFAVEVEAAQLTRDAVLNTVTGEEIGRFDEADHGLWRGPDGAVYSDVSIEATA